MVKIIKSLSLIVLGFLISNCAFSQDTKTPATPQDSAKTEGGIAVTPSHLYFVVAPGQSKTMTLKVTNNTRKIYKFELKFSDFEMGLTGKSTASKSGSHPNSLANWMVFSPTFFEVPAGQTQKVSVQLTVPDVPEANRAKWGILYVNQVTERKTIDVSAGPNNMGMGVIPSFGFAINVYQNPPNVAVKKVEITKFSNITSVTDDHVILELNAKNTGDGISFCMAYAEVINKKNGKKTRLGKKSFTALPGHDRVFKFDMPKDLEKGEYSVVGVLDYGSKEEIQAAELEFTIK